jgi:hypothetical protein
MLSGFMDFFYIGFVRFDILALKSELLGMFTFDEIRRLIFETLIPSIQKRSLDKSVRTLVSTLDNKVVDEAATLMKFQNKDHN